MACSVDGVLLRRGFAGELGVVVAGTLVVVVAFVRVVLGDLGGAVVAVGVVWYDTAPSHPPNLRLGEDGLLGCICK